METLKKIGDLAVSLFAGTIVVGSTNVIENKLDEVPNGTPLLLGVLASFGIYKFLRSHRQRKSVN